jgi:hypothetical protein
MILYGLGIEITIASWKATKRDHKFIKYYFLQVILLTAMSNQTRCL